jgi:hypothetical protein
MSRKAKEKIKPQWMRWYEDSFQADLRVRYMKPTQRHFYRALIIQSFYCGTRPYLPDNDDLLWMLADANDKEHWMEHAPVVRSMFTPVAIDDVPLLSHGKILREWKNTEQMYSGKASDRQGVKNGTQGQPRGTRSRTKVGDNRSEEQTGTDQNRPETRLPDPTLPESRVPERSEGNSKLTDLLTNRSQSTTTTSDSVSASQSASQSASAATPPRPIQKEVGQEAGAGQKPLGLGVSPQNRKAEGSGKPVTSKVQTFEEEEGFVTTGTTSADLIKRFWAIAAKKDFMGKSENAKDDADWMGAVVKMHGVEKIKLCLDHVARSDYWGATEKGKLNGIHGFHRALEAIYKQASAYLEKVKQSAMAKKMGGEL